MDPESDHSQSDSDDDEIRYEFESRRWRWDYRRTLAASRPRRLLKARVVDARRHKSVPRMSEKLKDPKWIFPNSREEALLRRTKNFTTLCRVTRLMSRARTRRWISRDLGRSAEKAR